MKLKGILAIILVLVLGACVAAQEATFTGFYPLTGNVVSETEGVSSTGRKVVFYAINEGDDPMDGPTAGFSYDFVETGLSGIADKYIISAFQDPNLSIDVGPKYYLAVVKGADNFGVNPIEVGISGYGFERYPTLTLKEGEGIADPGEHASRFGPKIEAIWFGLRKWQPKLVAAGESYVISDQPEIKCEVTSPYGINVSSLQIVQDEGSSVAKTYNISSIHFKEIKGMAESPTDITYVYNFAAEGNALDDGDHVLTFKASNAFGTTIEVCSVSIKAGPVEIIGTPINFPSPVHLRTDKEVIFQYGLTKNADIDLYVFDISARIVKKISCNSGTAGGYAGGTANPNKVPWNLITDQGTLLGSGIYLWNIVDRAGNRVLGKGKLTAVP